jgi:uncharacterized protein (DUF4213/DUF364 family)
MKVLKKIREEAIDSKIVSVHIGFFTTAVVSQSKDGKRHCGLATTLRFGICPGAVKKAGKFENMSVRKVSQLIFSGSGPEISVGMAALNSALPELPYRNLNAEKIIAEKSKNKNSAIIGHFPFTDKIRKTAKNLWVFELEPKDDKDLTADKMPEFLPKADVVAITALSLLNGSFDNILSFCKKSAFKIILGPSTPMSRVLLDSGINAVCGIKVENIPALTKALMEGANFRALPGKKMITLTSTEMENQ